MKTNPTQTPEDAGELRENRELWSMAMHIINRCGDTWAVPIADRQQWNDELDEYAMAKIQAYSAAEQTKLLEKIEGELPENEDVQRGHNFTGIAKNQVVNQVHSLLAKHKEGLKHE